MIIGGESPNPHVTAPDHQKHLHHALSTLLKCIPPRISQQEASYAAFCPQTPFRDPRVLSAAASLLVCEMGLPDVGVSPGLMHRMRHRRWPGVGGWRHDFKITFSLTI